MIELLARDSFGIYILHPVFQHLMTRYLDPLSWPAVASDVALSVVPLVLSIAVTHLLRRLPGFADKL
jgi:surface polysaccharide O-acyltransferase-like enzyme